MGALWSFLTAPGQAPVLAAAIALLGVVLSALISFSVARKSNYITAVTAERSKLIEKTRDSISDFVGAASYLYERVTADDEFVISTEYNELRKSIGKLAALAKLQLDPEGAADKNIFCLLGILPGLASSPSGDYERGEDLLIRHSQWALQGEWEKIKYEASGPVRALWGRRKRRLRRNRYRNFAEGEGALSALERPSN